MVKTKLAGSSGRFGVRYGVSARRRISAVELKQRKKQFCIFCKSRAKRISKGIWQCKRCGKKFAGHAYFLEQSAQDILNKKLEAIKSKEKKDKPKVLNKGENSIKEDKKLSKPRKTTKTKKIGLEEKE